ncbi:MAG: nitroreductase family protein [Gammaproteobacteria bacterium]|nr:nitroreductase family protein [Gammaproteobacteria bacterium]
MQPKAPERSPRNVNRAGKASSGKVAVASDFLDVASVDVVLSTTRSVRRKLDFDRAVPPEVIHDCVNLATQAPTGLGGENWRFMVVADPEKKRSLAALYKTVLTDLAKQRGIEVKATQQALVDRLHEIPAMIFVCTTADRPGTEVAGQVAYYGSILPAAWSLMLALRARNLGATWTTLLSARQEEVAAVLGMPPGVVQTVMLPVAYTKDARLKKADRLDAAQVTYWDSWGSDSP